MLVFDRNSSPFDESRALVPKGDRPLLRRGARTNFKRNSSVTAPNRPVLMNRKSESDCIDDGLETEPMIRSSSADGGVTLSDQTEPLSPVVEIEEIRDLCIASRPEPKPLQPQPVQQQRELQDPIILERSASASTANLQIGRKSSWSWAFWSDEKSSKKNNKIDLTEEQPQEEPQEQENNTRQPQVSKSSDAASIAATTSASSNGSSSKRFTLSSLFSRKSKHTSNLDSVITNGVLTKEAPKDFQLNKMYLTRLPLHVERAIYKLSHVKLANPRRPLHEQVLISNQMFWYLSIIASNPPDHQSSQQQQQHHHHQLQQKKKKPRKLVKKQRPPSPQQQQQQQQLQSSKLTKNAIASGGTFMANKSSSRESSTGFVVPDNYLNPKYQKKKSKVEYDLKLSDSSSGEEEEEEEDEEDQQKEDNVPLALYKTTSHRVK